MHGYVKGAGRFLGWGTEYASRRLLLMRCRDEALGLKGIVDAKSKPRTHVNSQITMRAHVAVCDDESQFAPMAAPMAAPFLA